MNNDSDRLKLAQWSLERNLAYIAAAEVKVGVLVAINTAMLGTLAAAFNPATTFEKSAWATVFTLSAGFCGIAALLCAALCLLPRVTGPKSLLFFGRIAELNNDKFIDEFRSADESNFLDDCLNQIYRNSKIACEKFSWVKAGMYWSFLSVLPWLMALALLVKV